MILKQPTIFLVWQVCINICNSGSTICNSYNDLTKVLMQFNGMLFYILSNKKKL